jgi:hypothetical protein
MCFGMSPKGLCIGILVLGVMMLRDGGPLRDEAHLGIVVLAYNSNYLTSSDQEYCSSRPVQAKNS